MKEFIYWPEYLHQTAPQLLGVLSSAEPFQWVGLPDVVAQVVAGESVQLRHASASEIKRAESMIALWDIGVKLSEHLETLLDQHGTDAVIEAKLSLQDAVLSLPGQLGQFNDPAVMVDVASRGAHLSEPSPKAVGN